MTVTVRTFATLRDRLGSSERRLEIQGPQTAREIFFSLFSDHEAAKLFLPSTRFAVNCEYVSPETLVRDGDELALIPPVSGG